MSHDSYTIEVEGERKRYRCTCGYVGGWQRDFGNYRQITADASIAWNHKVHAALSRGHNSVHVPKIDEHW